CRETGTCGDQQGKPLERTECLPMASEQPGDCNAERKERDRSRVGRRTPLADEMSHQRIEEQTPVVVRERKTVRGGEQAGSASRAERNSSQWPPEYLHEARGDRQHNAERDRSVHVRPEREQR